MMTTSEGGSLKRGSITRVHCISQLTERDKLGMNSLKRGSITRVHCISQLTERAYIVHITEVPFAFCLYL
jgi:hypothetical protein